MRIISGSFRGKKINAPANLPVRPTTDFAKEALFNILNNTYYFEDVSVLDLFSGIGSISLEFLSRGCKRLVSVDKEAGCAKFLDETVKSLKLEDASTIIRSDVFQFLKRNTQGNFDLVFADPPFEFEQDEYNDLVKLVFENNWIEANGEFILEHSSRVNFDNHPFLEDTRKYGNVNFSFFNRPL